MEEAERFDALIAMDAGRVVATGTADDLKNMTGRDTLEAAFIELLPEARRGGHRQLVLPPRQRHDGAPAIEARAPHHALRRFHRRRRRHDPHRARRDLRLPRLERLRQDDDHEDADRPAAAERRASARLFGRPVDARDLETRKRVGYMSQSFSLYAELTVRQNLDLHARLFHVPADEVEPRVAEMLDALRARRTSPTRCPTRCRSACASGCSSPSPSFTGPRC